MDNNIDLNKFNIIKRIGKFNYKIFFCSKKIGCSTFLTKFEVSISTNVFIYDNLIITSNDLIKILSSKCNKKNNEDSMIWLISFFYIEKFIFKNKKFKQYKFLYDNYKILLDVLKEKYNQLLLLVSKLNISLNNIYEFQNKDYCDILDNIIKAKNIFYKMLLANINDFKLLKKNIIDHSFPIIIKKDLKDKIYLDISIFRNTIKVNCLGISKAKGFCGVVKRYNFSKGPASHGSSLFHNRPGSIGTSGYARVLPGTKLPGRTGNKSKYIFNLKILNLLLYNCIISLKGNIPGYRNNLIYLIIK